MEMLKFYRTIKWIAITKSCSTHERDDSLWVFGEWFGRKCCDNCLWLANHIAKKHSEVSLAWIADAGVDTSMLDDSIRVVRRGSVDAYNLLKTAGVAVCNQGLVDFAQDGGCYTSGAVNVNLWHGVPWKRIGMDGASRNTLKRMHGRIVATWINKTDMFLVTSPEFGRIATSAFAVSDQGLIRAGYPRNSLFYHDEYIHQARERVFKAVLGDRLESFKQDSLVIVYMPTFRDRGERPYSFLSSKGAPALDRLLASNNALLFEKNHFVDNELRTGGFKENGERVFSAAGSTAQDLLCAADILISDYSSCVFDYLLLDRPIIHFLYDFETYASKDRGLYYEPQDVICGDVAYDEEGLFDSIRYNINEPSKNASLREERRRRFLTYESPDSSEIIFREIARYALEKR